MNKLTITSILIAIALVGAVIIIGNNKSGVDSNVPVNNVSMVDGKQIIEIRAKGGYTPRKSVASAGVPTILRLNTNGTFDCSSSVRIPSMNISQNLPQSGTTDIDLGSPSAKILDGTCGMGMYPFEIEFQN
jgi:plastocyanin domain-containing protein